MQNLKVILRSKSFFLFLFFLTFFVCLLFLFRPSSSKYSLENEIIGTVLSYKIDGDSLSFVLKGKEKVQVFYTIKDEEEKSLLEKTFGTGIIVLSRGSLENPKEAVLPNTFNYKKYLYYKHIYKIFNANQIEIIESANVIYQLKNDFTKYLKKLPNSEYFLIFLLGESNQLDMEYIRKNGVSHLFAISGMHLTFLISVLSIFLKRWKKWGTLFISIFLLFYVFLVSFTPSVMRVFAMYHFKILNKHMGNVYTERQMFFLVVCLFLLIDPYLLMNIGFQYSFLISFCFTFLKSNSNYFRNLLKTSFISFLASFPITAMNFYEVNFLSIILNLIFVPLVSLILYPFCFISLLFPFLHPIYGFLLSAFEILSKECAAISFFNIVIPKTTFFIWILYYFFFFCYLFKRKKIILLALCVIILGVKLTPKLTRASYIYFLDVSQGDSALFISPFQKEIIMIDTGGKIPVKKEAWQVRKVYDDALSITTFLHSLGISSITTLVLTHGDYDHLGNAISLLEKIPVNHIVLNRNEQNEMENVIIKKYPKKITSSLNSSFFQIEEFTYRYPKDENDASLIFRIGVYNKHFLMMGDASKTVEQKISNQNVASDVIKIGHHGSKTSSDYSFLKKVQAKYAVISVALKNRYGHPNKETLDNLNKLNIKPLLTSYLHTICFKVEKNHFKYIPFSLKT